MPALRVHIAQVQTHDPKALAEYLSIDPDLQEDGLPRPYHPQDVIHARGRQSAKEPVAPK